jgi:hypothetical protein
VYEVPFESPVIRQLRASPLFCTHVFTEPVVPVGEALTVYCVIVAPPESTGAFQETETPPFKGVNLIPTGAPGVDLGVLEIAFDDSDVPASFTAVTVMDWTAPFVKPLIVQVVFATEEPLTTVKPFTWQVCPEGIALATYRIIGEPLLSTFVEIALHLTTRL